MDWQEEALNDRKIGKLCDYAAKNPLRIPKVKFSFGFISMKVQQNVGIMLCEWCLRTFSGENHENSVCIFSFG